MGFFTPDQQVDHFERKINGCSWPLAGEQVDPRVPDHALVLPLLFRDTLLEGRKTGHIADWEKVMRHQYGRRRRADGGDNASGKMKLADRFHQQRAVAEILRAFYPTGKDDNVIIAVGDLYQRRIRQQLDASRADDSQAAIAGDAGRGDLHAAADQ